MEITTTIHDTATILAVTGRVDSMTAGALETALNDLIAEGAGRLFSILPG